MLVSYRGTVKTNVCMHCVLLMAVLVITSHQNKAEYFLIPQQVSLSDILYSCLYLCVTPSTHESWPFHVQSTLVPGCF